MTVPRREGGCLTQLGSGPFPEEYPTDPPSYVLNGSMFAMWGMRDVAVATQDASVAALWQDMVATLRDNLHRWDLGWWSKYDLFPHAARNPASSFYHALHIAQLRAMALLTGENAFTIVADRWQAYADSRPKSTRAFASKAKFRIIVPRHPWLAERIPWAKRGRRPDAGHAVSADDGACAASGGGSGSWARNVTTSSSPGLSSVARTARSRAPRGTRIGTALVRVEMRLVPTVRQPRPRYLTSIFA